MTLTEASSVLPKMERSPRGRVDMIKRSIPEDDASFIIFFRLESGSHAQISSPDQWPLPRDMV